MSENDDSRNGQSRNNNNNNNNNNNSNNSNRPKPPVVVDMQFAGWLRTAQFGVFMLNSLLNWVCIWFFAPPTAEEPVSALVGDVTATPSDVSIWAGWPWWAISISIAVFLQIVFVYVPMFVDENSRHFGRWRRILQRADSALNYVAYTIIICFIMQVSPELRQFLTTMWGLLNQLVVEFGGVLDLKIIITVLFIWMLARGTHRLGVITTLVPRTEVKGRSK